MNKNVFIAECIRKKTRELFYKTLVYYSYLSLKDYICYVWKNLHFALESQKTSHSLFTFKDGDFSCDVVHFVMYHYIVIQYL